MKRKMSIFLTGLLVVSMFAGCGKKNSTDNSEPTVQPEATQAVEEVENKEETKENEGKELEADIVIIGAGGAGMTAAIQAVQDGATNVVILEKMPQTGGNTIRSTGGLNASETTFQEADGIEDSNDLFFNDTMTGGKNLNDEALVHTLVDNSADALYWVNDLGADLTVVGMFGGASVKRIHRRSDTSAVGPVLVKTFNAQIEELQIPVLLETKADAILVDESGKVTGVKATDKDGEFVINCKAVIVATGGFGANQDMVVQYNSALAGFGTTNHAGATGDGIVMATALGAATVDMEQIQTHPTVDPETQTMYTEGVRGNGAILVNFEGKRFVNELETRDVVSAAILEQTNGQAWLLFDEDVRTSLSAIETYINKGIVVEADTIEELAGKINVDAAALQETMDTYAGYQAAGTDADFGRADMELPLTTSKFYAALCAPAIHHTMGGLKIDTTCEVLDENGTAIQGLYAAGEVTGGVHGGNRLGGNAVTDIVVFGRIAGSSAVSYVEANGGHTAATITVASEEETVAPEVQGNYKDGTYTGVGTGNGGEIKVEVVVEEGNIVSITLVECNETPGIYEGAEAGVTAAIIRTQSTEVDTVTGATNSSKGIMEAVANALEGAQN